MEFGEQNQALAERSESRPMFKNLKSARRAIRQLKQSEALSYKLDKFGATLIPSRIGQTGFGVYCYTPTTLNPNDEYDLIVLVKSAVESLTHQDTETNR